MQVKVEESMDRFFCFAGELEGTETVRVGGFPKTKFVQLFHYAHGEASFDGRKWTFALFDGAGE